MSFTGRLLGSILRPVSELQAGQRSFGELAERLEASGKTVMSRFMHAADIPHNREVLNHVTGIERWGQRRLRTALGEPFILDSYRGYRMAESASIEELRAAFAQTRSRTVALARELEAAAISPARTIRHNDLGELSLRGWLAYLNAHADRESRVRLRG